MQVSELTDTCEALTLDKEQLGLEKEELQASSCCCRIVVQSLEQSFGFGISAGR